MFDLISSLCARCARPLGALAARGFEAGRRARAAGPRSLAWGALVSGGLVSGSMALVLAAAPWASGTPRVTGWLLADRGADQLLHLDRDLNVIAWQPAAEPLRLVSRAPGSSADGELADGELADGELADGELADGGLADENTTGPDAWWIEGLGGDPFGPHRLHALALPLANGDGAPASESAALAAAGGQWDYLRDLTVDRRGVAYVLSGPLQEAQAELWSVRLGEAPVSLAALEGALQLEWAGGSLWCGGSEGRLWRLTIDGDIVVQAQIGAEVHALASRDAELWCLDAGGTLRRLTASLEVLWSVDLGFTPGPLAVDRDGVAWVAAEGQPFVQPIGPDGTLLGPVTDVGGDSWTDLDAHAPTPLGAAPGFVLQLDEFGSALASQGGFGYLSDLSALFAPGP